MKKEWKSDKLIAPLPAALVSCGTVEKPNALTISWTGFLNSEPLMTYVAVRPNRYSHQLIKEGGCFVINLPGKKLMQAVDFCGVKSGKNIDKFKECALTAVPSCRVQAPSIAECPISLECEVCDVISYPSHDVFVAKVLTTMLDDDFIVNGKFDFKAAELMMWAHRQYFEVGLFLENTFYTTKK